MTSVHRGVKQGTVPKSLKGQGVLVKRTVKHEDAIIYIYIIYISHLNKCDGQVADEEADEDGQNHLEQPAVLGTQPARA